MVMHVATKHLRLKPRLVAAKLTVIVAMNIVQMVRAWRVALTGTVKATASACSALIISVCPLKIAAPKIPNVPMDNAA